MMRRAARILLCVAGLAASIPGCKALDRELQYDSMTGAISPDSSLYTPPTGNHK